MISPMEAISLALEGKQGAVAEVLEDLMIFSLAQYAELKGDPAATEFASSLVVATMERRVERG